MYFYALRVRKWPWKIGIQAKDGSKIRMARKLGFLTAAAQMNMKRRAEVTGCGAGERGAARQSDQWRSGRMREPSWSMLAIAWAACMPVVP